MADVDARLNCTLSLIAAAQASSREQRDDWEQLASLATSMGGLEVGLLRQHGPQLLARAPAHLVDAPGHLHFSITWLHHRRQLPHVLAKCCTAYEAYRTQRNAIEAIYDEYAE